jgi:hypothetical protein
VFITKNKNRLKFYEVNTVFLKDGDEFELELFNPNSSTIKAKIQLNGEYISSSGLVLYPGERIFLERYLDSNRKFLFHTYDINPTDRDAVDASKDNGYLKIEFYEEDKPFKKAYYNLYQPYFTNTGTGVFGGTTTTTSSSPLRDSQTYTCDNVEFGVAGNNVFFSQTNIGGSSATMDSVDLEGSITTSNFTASASMETGRVDEGSVSDQDFTYVDKNFKYWTFSEVEIQLLPESRKVIESKDIRVYCTSCGTRQKKSNWKFCPSCGGKY